MGLGFGGEQAMSLELLEKVCAPLGCLHTHWCDASFPSGTGAPREPPRAHNRRGAEPSLPGPRSRLPGGLLEHLIGLAADHAHVADEARGDAAHALALPLLPHRVRNLTGLLCSATKQYGQTKSEYSRMRTLMAHLSRQEGVSLLAA